MRFEFIPERIAILREESRTTPTANRQSAQGALFTRALKLTCPACGAAPIFRGWFRMHNQCSACGRPFNREPGYLLGSVYFNYGVTASLVVIAYFGLYFGTELTGSQLLVLLGAFSLVFPLWFFRYARSLWIAFDERWDPWTDDFGAESIQREAADTDS